MSRFQVRRLDPGRPATAHLDPLRHGRFGYGTGSHMPFGDAGAMVMAARDLAAPTAGIASDAGMGFTITRTTLPPAPVVVDQDDVVMAESGRAATRSERSRTSRHRSLRHDDSTFHDPTSGDERYRRNRRSKSRHSTRTRSRSPSRHSRRSSRSLRSDRSALSRTSGATQVALNSMRQVQDAVAEMRQTQESSFGQIAEGLRQELGRLV
jgi:hypothetical protein